MSSSDLAGKSENLRTLAQNFKNIEIRNEILGLTDVETNTSFRIVVARKLTEKVIEQMHENTAHERTNKLLFRICQSFYWTRMGRDIKLFIIACPVCDKFKAQTRIPKFPLTPVRVGFRGETLAIDVVGGKETLPVTPRGNKYILTMIDLFTRYLIAVPIPNQFSVTICDAVMNKFILIYGAPFRLFTDRGDNFESAAFSNLCMLWRIQKIRTTAYHPAGNGACERVNRTIKRGLQKMLNEQNLHE